MKQKLIKLLLPLVLLFACLGFAACGTYEEPLPKQLKKPKNFQLEDGVITWNEVENADGYAVSIDGEEHFTPDCRYDLTTLERAGAYEIGVRAYSDREIADSDPIETEYVVPTEGLEYRLVGSGDSAYYSVNKLAVDEYGACIIPPTHEGLPVKKFNSTPGNTVTLVKTLYFPACIDETYFSYAPDRTRFRRYESLENIKIGKGTERYISEGNCVIDKKENTLIIGCINCEIPSYVTTIGEDAFRGRNLVNFTVPDTVRRIGESAFANCTALEKIVLPQRLMNGTANTTLNSVFEHCTSLKELNIPKGTTTLAGTFRGCTSLEKIEIPQGVKSLGLTFLNCTALTEVSVPNSVTSMTETFYGCSSLKKVNIPTGIRDLNRTFLHCTSLESISVPGNIRTLYGTFGYCASLKNVEIAEGVTNLGIEYPEWTGQIPPISVNDTSTFVNCTSLKQISLPSTVKSLGEETFTGCTSLESLEIPPKVVMIGESLFQGCTSLSSIEIPSGIVGVARSAFENCSSLTFIDLPVEVVRIGNAAFRGCTALRSAVIRGATEINDYAFSDCALLNALVIPNVTQIARSTFANCPITEILYSGTEADWAEKVTIPESGNSAFRAATRYYYSETEPEEAGNFWHYIDGVPTKWA